MRGSPTKPHGTLPGRWSACAARRRTLDYWATCGRASAEWLSEHYQEYTPNPAPIVSAPTSDPGLIRHFLPPSFRAARNPDFYIGFTRGANGESYPTYTVIPTLAAQGMPLCVIKVSPDTARP